MIKFRQKVFTIPEGHYTGPKDIDKVPGVLEMVGKSAAAGAGIGAVAGSLMKDSDMLSGALTGGKYGTITGIILKFFLNYLHNPMSKVKYQEVDKLIRREFGIFSASGFTIGDTLDKRASVEEKFGFNDRNISSYKLNFAIQDGSITMYTFGMTDKELEETSKVLDYYCKKYFSMEYTSSLINRKLNSYSVNIVFTNYQVISNFIMELSKKLGTRINLMDNRALVKQRIKESLEEKGEEVREFSVKEISKYDLIDILGTSASIGLSYTSTGMGNVITATVLGLLLKSLEKLTNNEISRIGKGKLLRSAANNVFLEECLKRLRKIEGFNYTVGDLESSCNISLVSGLFIITTKKNSKESELIDKMISRNKIEINRSDTGEVIVYTYPVKSKNDFELFLNKLFSLRIKFNIFER